MSSRKYDSQKSTATSLSPLSTRMNRMIYACRIGHQDGLFKKFMYQTLSQNIYGLLSSAYFFQSKGVASSLSQAAS